jgi:hypothetical protein
MANPEFLDFGVMAESLVINVPSFTWLSPISQYVFYSSGRKVAGCALP